MKKLCRYLDGDLLPNNKWFGPQSNSFFRFDEIKSGYENNSQFQLPPPQLVSCGASVKKDIYIKLATMAAFP